MTRTNTKQQAFDVLFEHLAERFSGAKDNAILEAKADLLTLCALYLQLYEPDTPVSES